jgi:hypothetical protein
VYDPSSLEGAGGYGDSFQLKAAHGSVVGLQNTADEPAVEVERRSISEALRKSGGKTYGAGGATELLGMRPTTLISRSRLWGSNGTDASYTHMVMKVLAIKPDRGIQLK